MIRVILCVASLLAFLSFTALLFGNPYVMPRDEVKGWCLILLTSCAVLVPWMIK